MTAIESDFMLSHTYAAWNHSVSGGEDAHFGFGTVRSASLAWHRVTGLKISTRPRLQAGAYCLMPNVGAKASV